MWTQNTGSETKGVLQVKLLEAVCVVVSGKRLPCASRCPAGTELLSGNLLEPADVAPHIGYPSHAISDHILKVHIGTIAQVGLAQQICSMQTELVAFAVIRGR